MDKASALHILTLGPNATRTEAKKVYRQMAKSCHPDRFAGRPEALGAEIRMKQLNQAFDLLMTLLPEATSQVEPTNEPVQEDPVPKANSTPPPGFFSALRKRVGSFKGPGRGRKPPAAGRRGQVPGVKKAAGNRTAPGTKTGRSTGRDSFDSVLKGVRKGDLPCRKSSASGAPAYDAYSRYIRLKHHMTSQTRRSQAGDSGRVERISPVKAVRRVDGS